MSCELHSRENPSARPTGELADSTVCFIETMADGLHAMAQSLTVLRGALGALQAAQSADVKPYLEMASRQSAVMNDLFCALRATLDSVSIPTRSQNIDISALTHIALHDMQTELSCKEQTIVFHDAESPAQTVGDAEQTDRAIRAALRAAISLTPRRQKIHLSLQMQLPVVEVRIQADCNEAKHQSFADQLNLSLVQRSVQSQGGQSCFLEDPMTISFSLPAFSSESNEEERQGLVPRAELSFLPICCLENPQIARG